MVNVLAWFILAIFALVVLWAAHRLWVIATATITLWRTGTTDATTAGHGDTVAVDGQVFVDDPAPLADRVFDPTEGPVGAYIWRAWFSDSGRYTYDFDRGELRQGRNPFAAGVETGAFGVTTSGRDLSVALSWLDRSYDGEDLDGLEVGNPASNTSLPAFLTRYVYDSLYVSLDRLVADCDVDRLLDTVDLYRSDVQTDEFGIGARGIPAGQRLFVHGELRVENGTPTIVGTDETPLLISDEGRGGLKRELWWRAVKYAIALVGAAAAIAFFAPV
jgi:hypothetical protein